MTTDLYNYHRRATYNVHVGRTPLGSNYPVRLQSMTTTSTDDIEGSVEQVKRIVRAGADYVRLTTQGLREVESLREIHDRLRAQHIRVPLVADVHFNPAVADAAAAVVEAVRINPGNYVDPARKFVHIDYTDEQYAAELRRLEERFSQLLDICRLHRTALRIGVNHGSLSDRIMSRYGDTPEGIVESCMEFLRVCVRRNFQDVVISIKASNPVVMVQSVRLLVDTMDREGMAFPLHLGVTEAGEGEDGRIKSALGIGALLSDGIGDTIRVSLSEEPEREIPVARKLVQHTLLRRGKKRISGITPADFCYTRPERRKTLPVMNIGGDHVPVVIGVGTPKGSYGLDCRPDFVYIGGFDSTRDYDHSMSYIVDATNYNDRPGVFPPYTTETMNLLPQSKAPLKFLEVVPFFYNEEVAECLRNNPVAVLVIRSDSRNSLGETRAIIHSLMRQGITNPVIFCKGYDADETREEDVEIESAADTGALLFDRLIDGLPCHVVSGRHPGLLHLVEFHRRAPSLRLLDDGEPVLPADPVRRVLQLRIPVRAHVEALAVAEGNAVDNKMIVEMIGIQMRGDDDLEPVAPQLLRKLDADCVGFLRRRLSFREALIGVQGDDAALLIKADLRVLELVPCREDAAVDPSREESLLRFLLVRGVGDDIRQRLPVFFREVFLRFLRVLHILKRRSRIATDPPDLRYCHLRSLRFGRMNSFSTSDWNLYQRFASSSKRFAVSGSFT